jgi:16S rRNA processing protein RimM
MERETLSDGRGTVMAAWDEMVLVGRVIRPHHNRGHVLVAAETDFPEARFAPGNSVHCRRAGRDETLTVVECKFHDGKPIVGFEGFDSINAAETLRGCELRVPASELPVLEAGQFWHHELVGCQVVTSTGESVGEVIRVDDGATPLLVMRNLSDGASAKADETLIPLVDSICRSVDVAARKIVIEPIAGLLDVNKRGNA